MAHSTFDMDRVLGRWFCRWIHGDEFPGLFRVDVRETSSKFVLECDLPGIRKEDIDITLDANELTIAALRKTNRTERLSRTSRAFKLPKECRTDEEAVIARLEMGVLTLEIAKIVSDGSHTQRRKIAIEG